MSRPCEYRGEETGISRSKAWATYNGVTRNVEHLSGKTNSRRNSLGPSLHLLARIAFNNQSAVDVGSIVICSSRLSNLRGGDVACLLGPALVYRCQTPFSTLPRSSDRFIAYE